MSKVHVQKDIFAILSQNIMLLRRFGVRRIGLFGSFARNQQQENSDIDLLVEFIPDEKTYRHFINLAYTLEDLFGRKVELVTHESLSPYIKPYIIKEVKYLEVA